MGDNKLLLWGIIFPTIKVKPFQKLKEINNFRRIIGNKRVVKIFT